MKYFLLFLYLSAFISITLMEGLILVTLCILLYQLFKESPRLLIRGTIAIPLHMYISTTVLSTIFFFPKMTLKALGEGLFQLTYFFKIRKEIAALLAEKVPLLSVLAGFLLLPALVYHSITIRSPKLLWGGHFETGNFYSMFAISSIILAFSELTQKRKKTALFLLTVSILFVGIVVYSTRRSSLLALFLTLFLVITLLYRNRIISGKQLFAFSVSSLSLITAGYIYLSAKDHRFQLLNKMITGEVKINMENIDRLSSRRVKLLQDGLKIIEKDIQETNLIHLMIGHGVRSGLVLPHWHSARGIQRYESIFIISEFIEKGLVGVIGEILIMFLAIKRFISVKVMGRKDILAITLFVPLIIHLFATIFTFFWDAVLPVYLLLFKAGEVYFSDKERSSRNPHLSG